MEKIDIEKFRVEVIEKLQKAKLNQVTFAALAGMTQPTLSRFLSGDNIPTIDSINKIMDALSTIKDEGVDDDHRAA